jgi:hypothetical protein
MGNVPDAGARNDRRGRTRQCRRMHLLALTPQRERFVMAARLGRGAHRERERMHGRCGSPRARMHVVEELQRLAVLLYTEQRGHVGGGELRVCGHVCALGELPDELCLGESGSGSGCLHCGREGVHSRGECLVALCALRDHPVERLQPG